ncbi:uncharacterized [Tachysurus ichikawai]
MPGLCLVAAVGESRAGDHWYVNNATRLRCETARRDIRSIHECHMAGDHGSWPWRMPLTINLILKKTSF